MSRYASTCLFLTVLLLSSALPLAAQPGDKDFDLSIVLEPGGSYSDSDGADLDLGYGLGFGWRFGARWGVELRALRNEGRFIDTDNVELGLRRFLGAPRAWRPFVSFGAHLEDTDVTCGGPAVLCLSTPDPSNELGAFGGGGVDWQFSERSGLRFEGRATFIDTDEPGHDAADLDVTAGYVFRF